MKKYFTSWITYIPGLIVTGIWLTQWKLYEQFTQNLSSILISVLLYTFILHSVIIACGKMGGVVLDAKKSNLQRLLTVTYTVVVAGSVFFGWQMFSHDASTHEYAVNAGYLVVVGWVLLLLMAWFPQKGSKTSHATKSRQASTVGRELRTQEDEEHAEQMERKMQQKPFPGQQQEPYRTRI